MEEKTKPSKIDHILCTSFFEEIDFDTFGNVMNQIYLFYLINLSIWTPMLKVISLPARILCRSGNINNCPVMTMINSGLADNLISLICSKCTGGIPIGFGPVNEKCFVLPIKLENRHIPQIYDS
jgi:hypothetical protein